MKDFTHIFIFDVETTGIDPGTNQITNIAYNEISLHPEATFFSTTQSEYFISLKPDIVYEERIQKMTGITTEKLRDSGQPEEKVCRHLAEHFHKNKTLFIAHNAQFDMTFLMRMFENCGYPFPPKKQWGVIDTLTVLKDRKCFPHKLSDAIQHYKIPNVSNAHNAMDDVKALTAVVMAMQAEKPIEPYIDIFGVNPSYGIMFEKINGITYKPQPYRRNFYSNLPSSYGEI